MCFRSCLTLFNFQGPPSLAYASLFKYALEDFDNPHFAWRRKRSYLQCCFDLSYCSLADSLHIIPLQNAFVNTFLKVFLHFCDFFLPSTFCTISADKTLSLCAKSIHYMRLYIICIIVPIYCHGTSHSPTTDNINKQQRQEIPCRCHNLIIRLLLPSCPPEHWSPREFWR